MAHIVNPYLFRLNYVVFWSAALVVKKKFSAYFDTRNLFINDFIDFFFKKNKNIEKYMLYLLFFKIIYNNNTLSLFLVFKQHKKFIKKKIIMLKKTKKNFLFLNKKKFLVKYFIIKKANVSLIFNTNSLNIFLKKIENRNLKNFYNLKPILSKNRIVKKIKKKVIIDKQLIIYETLKKFNKLKTLKKKKELKKFRKFCYNPVNFTFNINKKAFIYLNNSLKGKFIQYSLKKIKKPKRKKYRRKYYFSKNVLLKKIKFYNRFFVKKKNIKNIFFSNKKLVSVLKTIEKKRRYRNYRMKKKIKSRLRKKIYFNAFYIYKLKNLVTRKKFKNKLSVKRFFLNIKIKKKKFFKKFVLYKSNFLKYSLNKFLYKPRLKGRNWTKKNNFHKNFIHNQLEIFNLKKLNTYRSKLTSMLFSKTFSLYKFFKLVKRVRKEKRLKRKKHFTDWTEQYRYYYNIFFGKKYEKQYNHEKHLYFKKTKYLLPQRENLKRQVDNFIFNGKKLNKFAKNFYKKKNEGFVFKVDKKKIYDSLTKRLKLLVFKSRFEDGRLDERFDDSYIWGNRISGVNNLNYKIKNKEKKLYLKYYLIKTRKNAFKFIKKELIVKKKIRRGRRFYKKRLKKKIFCEDFKRVNIYNSYLNNLNKDNVFGDKKLKFLKLKQKEFFFRKYKARKKNVKKQKNKKKFYDVVSSSKLFSKFFLFEHYLKFFKLKKKIFKYFFLLFPKMDLNIIFVVKSFWSSFVTSDMIAEYFILRLLQKKLVIEIMKPMLKFLSKAIKKENIYGYAILLMGRFTRKDRATFKWYKKGPFTKSNRIIFIDYANRKVYLRFSTCSFKISLIKTIGYKNL